MLTVRLHQAGRIALVMAMLLGAAACTRYRAARAHPGEGARSSDGFVATADGIRLFYRMEGTGRDTVIAIHGGPTFGLGDLWPDLEWMTRRHVVIFYDLRGTGPLPRDTTILAMQNHVDDLDAVVQHFRLSHPVLVGHSFGGGVAILYAASHPAVVERLVLLEPLSPRPAATRSDYEANLRARATPADVAEVRRAREPARLDADPLSACRALQRVYLRLSVGTDSLAQHVAANWCAMSPEAFLYAVRHLAPASDRTLATADYAGLGKAARAPALIIAGSLDPWPWQVAEEWARILPDARLLLIRGAGHYAHAERRDLVEPAVEQFLQGRWPAEAISVTPTH